MKKFFIVLLILLLLLAIIGGIAASGLFAAGLLGYEAYTDYVDQDWTGKSYEEIVAYRAENPHVTIHYTVTIDGGSAPLALQNGVTEVTLENTAQLESLTAQAEYLQTLTHIDLGEIPMRLEEADALRSTFPNVQLTYRFVKALGTTYPIDTTHLDLSAMTADKLDYAIGELKQLPSLATINLLGADGKPLLSVNDALKLQSAYPQVKLTYAFDMYGQWLTTDMESVTYSEVEIGDAGLPYFENIFPLMYNLDYLLLDKCETSDEATAALREKYADQFKVVWRVSFGQFHMLTDTYRLWGNQSLYDYNTEQLKYFNEVKYLDLGHNFFTKTDFLAYMPDLETCIIACGKLEDISALANCKKIKYLEILDNHHLTNEDMQVIGQLTNLEHLNVSNMTGITDLSFTDTLPNLKRLWCTQFRGTMAELNRVKNLHPDTQTMLSKGGEAVSHGWRYIGNAENNVKSVPYALISAQFDYDNWGYAKYPRGYSRDIVTYESLGLTPP